MYSGGQGMDESWPFMWVMVANGWNVTMLSLSTMGFMCMGFVGAPFASNIVALPFIEV